VTKICDIVPGNVRLEIDLGIQGPPPYLQIQTCGWHNYTDRDTLLLFNIFIRIEEMNIGSTSSFIMLKASSPSKRTCNIISIPLSNDLIRFIEEVRSKKNGDIETVLSINCYYIGLPVSPQYGIYLSTAGPISRDERFKIGLTDWKNALGLKDFTPILINRNFINTLDELRRKWGLFTLEEVITRLVELYRGVEIKGVFELLFTDPMIKTIKSKLSSLTESGLWNEIDVISLYIDHNGAEYLLKLKKRGARIRLITRKSDKKAHEDALKSLRENNIEIKYNNMAHARLIIFDEDAVIITSADLDVEGLDNQRQIGIYTTDKNIIRTCKTFFNKLWEEASSS
jgi:hypothetical protein